MIPNLNKKTRYKIEITFEKMKEGNNSELPVYINEYFIDSLRLMCSSLNIKKKKLYIDETD